jgi:hypothetical protein
MAEDQKIALLLVEHKTLRDEIIARTNHGYQLITFGSSGVAILVSLSEKTHLLLVTTSALICILIVACFFMKRDISKASARIREIEADVNQRVGEDILVWENLWGSAKTGVFGRARPLPRSTLSKSAKPLRTFNGVQLIERQEKKSTNIPQRTLT